MPEIKSIAPNLFKVGSLLAITFRGPWKGEVTVKEEHLSLIDGAKNPFMKNGELILLPSENLRPFEQVKRRVDSRIKNMTGKFVEELPMIRLVNNLDFLDVDEYLTQEREAYAKVAADYVQDHFSVDVAKRREELSKSFPRFAPHLDEYYISATAALSRCSMKHLFFKVEDVERLDAIMGEQQSSLASTLSSFVSDLAKDFRETAVDACIAFKKGMDRAGATVDSRSVIKFKEWLKRFERQDFLGDTTMRDLLNNVKEHVFDVQSWTVEGNRDAMERIRQHLDQVITAGQNEGEALGVAARFCQPGEDSIALEDLDVQERRD